MNARVAFQIFAVMCLFFNGHHHAALASDGISHIDLPISINLSFDQRSGSLSVEIKNLSKESLWLNEISLTNPEIMFTRKTLIGFGGGSKPIGLNRQDIGSYLESPKGSKDILDVSIELKENGLYKFILPLQGFLSSIYKNTPKEEVNYGVNIRLKFFNLISEKQPFDKMTFSSPWILIPKESMDN